MGTRGDFLAPLPQARSLFQRVRSRDERIVLYRGTAHGIDPVEEPAYGVRTPALDPALDRRAVVTGTVAHPQSLFAHLRAAASTARTSRPSCSTV